MSVVYENSVDFTTRTQQREELASLGWKIHVTPHFHYTFTSPKGVFCPNLASAWSHLKHGVKPPPKLNRNIKMDLLSEKAAKEQFDSLDDAGRREYAAKYEKADDDEGEDEEESGEDGSGGGMGGSRGRRHSSAVNYAESGGDDDELSESEDDDGRTRASAAKSGSKRKAVSRKNGKGEKAEPQMSALSYYMKSGRTAVREANPAMGFADITKKLGADWKTLGAEKKKPFEEMSAANKIRRSPVLDGGHVKYVLPLRVCITCCVFV